MAVARHLNDDEEGVEEDKVCEAVVLVEEAGLVAEVWPQAVVPIAEDH